MYVCKVLQIRKPVMQYIVGNALHIERVLHTAYFKKISHLFPIKGRSKVEKYLYFFLMVNRTLSNEACLQDNFF